METTLIWSVMDKGYVIGTKFAKVNRLFLQKKIRNWSWIKICDFYIVIIIIRILLNMK